MKLNNILSVKITNKIVSLLVLLSLVISKNIFAQNQLKETKYTIHQDELIVYLSNKYKLNNKKITLQKEYQIESLIGKHITYSCLHNGIKMNNFFVKIHLNKYSKIYSIQENISHIQKIIIKDYLFDTKSILKELEKKYKIDLYNEVYVLNDANYFEKALLIRTYNENEDIYIERIYTSEKEFIDRDLKVHFCPIDTTIKGSVFLPDPLTSAEQVYGENNYKDSFEKDTNAIVIQTIANVGQASINVPSISFTFEGENGNLLAQSVANSFSGSTIYFVFEEIYLDGVNSNLGYNAIFIDDISNFRTKVIYEDYDFFELNAEQFDIEVLGYFSSSEFQLKNPYFELANFSPPAVIPYTSSVNSFTFTRNNDSFEEINAFYHVNNFYSYIENLGFVNLSPQKIKLDVHANNGADNSYFVSTPSPRLAFGNGGVDDAEDASVVIHEYIHALSYFAAPNTNIGKERQALDEALGDYFASSYISDYGDFTKGQVFPWDGHNEFWSGRISNSDSTYNELNLSKSIYYNAQIMSATLIDIFYKIGKEATDKLVLQSMFMNSSENTYIDVANNLLVIDSILFEGKYKCDIYNILVKRNFKNGYCIGNKLVDEQGIFVLASEEFSRREANAEIHIVEDGFEKMDVWISNSLGQILYKQTNIQESYIEINPKYFNTKGMLYVRIQTNNDKYKTKLLVY